MSLYPELGAFFSSKDRHKCLQKHPVFAGFDGFVDKIMHPVDRRWGPGQDFQAIQTIRAFGERIAAAAGKSTNIEWFPALEKMGGNGPILAQALCNAGVPVTYVGCLGEPIDPIFHTLTEKAEVHTIGQPGISHAAEFQDGKIILGAMAPLSEITYERIEQKVGERLLQSLSTASLAAFVNWTMIPHMSAILESIEERLRKTASHPKAFFFDLADPEKRSREDLQGILGIIQRYETIGKTYLGLNLSEAQQVYRLWGSDLPPETPTGHQTLASTIRRKLSIHCVAIHPTTCAACATPTETLFVEGPYTPTPRITTGAGDHFNAGLILGTLLEAPTTVCLQLAVSFSGFYVRNAQSPTIPEALSL